jgi:hypothetical protein
METKPVNKWREIGEAILNCDEELPGNPQPVQFRTIAEMEGRQIAIKRAKERNIPAEAQSVDYVKLVREDRNR